MDSEIIENNHKFNKVKTEMVNEPLMVDNSHFSTANANFDSVNPDLGKENGPNLFVFNGNGNSKVKLQNLNESKIKDKFNFNKSDGKVQIDSKLLENCVVQKNLEPVYSEFDRLKKSFFESVENRFKKSLLKSDTKIVESVSKTEILNKTEEKMNSIVENSPIQKDNDLMGSFLKSEDERESHTKIVASTSNYGVANKTEEKVNSIVENSPIQKDKDLMGSFLKSEEERESHTKIVASTSNYGVANKTEEKVNSIVENSPIQKDKDLMGSFLKSVDEREALHTKIVASTSNYGVANKTEEKVTPILTIHNDKSIDINICICSFSQSVNESKKHTKKYGKINSKIEMKRDTTSEASNIEKQETLIKVTSSKNKSSDYELMSSFLQSVDEREKNAKKNAKTDSKSKVKSDSTSEPSKTEKQETLLKNACTEHKSLSNELMSSSVKNVNEKETKIEKTLKTKVKSNTASEPSKTKKQKKLLKSSCTGDNLSSSVKNVNEKETKIKKTLKTIVKSNTASEPRKTESSSSKFNPLDNDLMSSFLQSVDERGKNTMKTSKTKSKLQIKRENPEPTETEKQKYVLKSSCTEHKSFDNDLMSSSVKNVKSDTASKPSKTEKHETVLKSSCTEHKSFDIDLMSSFLQSVNEREKNINKISKTNSKIQIKRDTPEPSNIEKQETLNLLKSSFDNLPTIGKVKPNLVLDCIIPTVTAKVIEKDSTTGDGSTDSAETLKELYTFENYNTDTKVSAKLELVITRKNDPGVNSEDIKKELLDLMEAARHMDFSDFESRLPKCPDCKNPVFLCMCPPPPPPSQNTKTFKEATKCRNCWMFPKNIGDFIICDECVKVDYPDVNHFCSKNCQNIWWEKEHMAEHLEFDLGLSDFNKK